MTTDSPCYCGGPEIRDAELQLVLEYTEIWPDHSQKKKKMEGNKDDNLGRDEKKRVAKKNMDVENRCKRYAVKKIHERIRINARMLFVQNGHMSR